MGEWLVLVLVLKTREQLEYDEAAARAMLFVHQMCAEAQHETNKETMQRLQDLHQYQESYVCKEAKISNEALEAWLLERTTRFSMSQGKEENYSLSQYC